MKKKIMTTILIALMEIVFLIDQVNAETINTTSKTYRVRLYFPDQDSTTWSNDINMGTATTTDSGEGIPDAFRANFTYSSNFQKNQNYIANIQIATTSPNIGTATMRSVACRGAGDETNIKSCNLVDMQVNSNGYTTYRILFVPKTNVTTVDLRLYTTDKISYHTVNIRSQSYIETVESDADIINNQTDILVTNSNQNTQDIINNQNNLYLSDCENLLNIPNGSYTNNGVTAVVQNGVITLTGTATANSFINIPLSSNINIRKNTYYKLSANNNRSVGADGTGTWAGIRTQTSVSDSNTISVNFSKSNNTKVLSYESAKTMTYFTIRTGNTISYDDMYIKPMLVEGNRNISFCAYGSKVNKMDETNDILNQDHSYNTNPSQSTTNEQNQMNSFETEEDNLRNSLDLSIEESEITINPIASSFIWDTVNRLRAMSGKIVLLFTSVLSLGIMKMILGR